MEARCSSRLASGCDKSRVPENLPAGGPPQPSPITLHGLSGHASTAGAGGAVSRMRPGAGHGTRTSCAAGGVTVSKLITHAIHVHVHPGSTRRQPSTVKKSRTLSGAQTHRHPRATVPFARCDAPPVHRNVHDRQTDGHTKHAKRPRLPTEISALILRRTPLRKHASWHRKVRSSSCTPRCFPSALCWLAARPSHSGATCSVFSRQHAQTTWRHGIEPCPARSVIDLNAYCPSSGIDESCMQTGEQRSEHDYIS